MKILHKKSIFCVLVLCRFMLLSIAQVNLQDAGYGDVSADGEFNAEDVSLIKDHLMERIDLSDYYEGEAGYTDPTGHALTIADANRDDTFDLEDIAWLCKTYNADAEITIYLDADYPANKDIPMIFARIPGGIYDRGSPEDERSRWDSEGPLHEVTVAYDFYRAKYPVTPAAVAGSARQLARNSAFYRL